MSVVHENVIMVGSTDTICAFEKITFLLFFSVASLAAKRSF